jgi:release factor glutamine methyltransferase
MTNYLQLTHENIKRNQALPFLHTFEFNQRTFIGLNTVFSPIIFQDTFFFTNHLPIKIGGSFLEIGCGTGLIAVNAAINGFQKVVGADINPAAVLNTKLNTVLNKMEERMTVLESDVFDGIDPHLFPAFDVIFWNLPFINEGNTAVSDLEKSVFTNYSIALEKYIASAKQKLTKDGQVFIGFSSSCGDMDLLNEICQKNNATLILIARKTMKDIDVELFEIEYLRS